MENIKNAADKLVCRVDKARKMVEIVSKGYKTTVRFLDNDFIEIVNADKSA